MRDKITWDEKGYSEPGRWDQQTILVPSAFDIFQIVSIIVAIYAVAILRIG